MGATAPLPMKKCPKCGSEQPNDAAFCPDDGAPLEELDLVPPPSDPYLGKVIAGDIEVRSVAGAGAMGRVYRAWQRGIERDVAVKILHRELGSNTSLVSRFHREAKIASKLQHPHVVEVYMAGQLPDGAMYIVMEYLDGMSLASALASAGGHFPLERAIPIALQICDAVGEGHARGIIHRDLKPENVMLVRRADTSDWVKVLDFGIARVNLGDQSMETAAGLIFGTARYISPEGAQGAPVGPPADVYSIATMIYQMFAGRTPFQADTAVALLVKQIAVAGVGFRNFPMHILELFQTMLQHITKIVEAFLAMIGCMVLHDTASGKCCMGCDHKQHGGGDQESMGHAQRLAHCREANQHQGNCRCREKVGPTRRLRMDARASTSKVERRRQPQQRTARGPTPRRTERPLGRSRL